MARRAFVLPRACGAQGPFQRQSSAEPLPEGQRHEEGESLPEISRCRVLESLHCRQPSPLRGRPWHDRKSSDMSRRTQTLLRRRLDSRIPLVDQAADRFALPLFATDRIPVARVRPEIEDPRKPESTAGSSLDAKGPGTLAG